MGGKKIVIVKRLNELKGDDKALISYFSSPNKNTYLIFTSDKTYNNKKIFKTLKANKLLVEFKVKSSNDISSFVNNFLKNEGKTINRDALNYLLLCIDNSLNNICNELTKIINFVGDNKKITLKDVEAMVKDLSTETIFKLTDAVGEKNLTKSITFLNSLLYQGEVPQIILSMLARQFRLILLVKTLTMKKLPDQQIIKMAKIQPFILKKLKLQSRKFTKEALIKSFEGLVNIDRATKTTDKNPKFLLESFIFDVCS